MVSSMVWRPLRRALLVILLLVSGTARADLAEFDGTTFDNGLFHINRFDWMDFDSYDTWVSWPQMHPDEAPNGVTPYVGERFVYDDNVYRLPAQIPPLLSTPIASRADYVNTVTAGVDGHLAASGQSLELLAKADENHFDRNGVLDNTAVAARLLGDWTIGSRLTGEVGVSYDRALNDFANYQVYTKDLVSTESVFGQAHFDLGSRWQLNATARDSQTKHSSSDVEYRNDGGTLSAVYHTLGGTYVSAIYQYTTGRFPLPIFVEHSESLQIDSPLGNNFRVRGDVGYIRHDYSDASQYDFSGGIWDAQLAWQPLTRIQLLVGGSRQVHAYIDAQSQYFVSEAVNAIAAWAPTGKLTCELEISREDQHFIGPNQSVISLTLPEHNVIHTKQLNLAWSVARPLQVVLSYRYLTRSSNADVFVFDDSFVTASLQARF
jgi:hypothetical protein